MATASRQQLDNPQTLSVVPNRKKFVRLTLWPLVAATFFMVSGGTYGTEDIVHGAGYGRAILILLLTPLLWSLPTAFMIGELSGALPYEGGYYAWVRRAMGNFWGFQEAWLSLVASIFDMAIYPTLFVLYLDRLFPWFPAGTPWPLRGHGGGHRLRPAQYRRREGRLPHLALAVLRPVGAISGHHLASLRLSSEPSQSPPIRQNPMSASLPASSSACGTTWDGTTLLRSQQKLKSRSAPIRARCCWPS